MNSLKIAEVLENFPFRAIRDRQRKVIEDICNALNSGCKHIILEAPTGFGKSAVGISLARTLGTSYVCTATKDLQSQYARDFPFLRVAKRNNNEEWYYLQTALKLVQAYGRSVRSKEDWAKTYILDAAFGYLVRKKQELSARLVYV
jgi:Rad3-related DNA helicase